MDSTGSRKRGGPTGLDLTGLVADVFMLWWDRQFMNILKKLNISLDIYGRFKDDCNILSDLLPKGLGLTAIIVSYST